MIIFVLFNFFSFVVKMTSGIDDPTLPYVESLKQMYVYVIKIEN